MNDFQIWVDTGFILPKRTLAIEATLEPGDEGEYIYAPQQPSPSGAFAWLVGKGVSITEVIVCNVPLKTGIHKGRIINIPRWRIGCSIVFRVKADTEATS